MFGAYTHCSWPTGNGVVADSTGKSFLFSLVNKADKAVRFSLRDKDRAIHVGSDGLKFGAANFEGAKATGSPNFVLMRNREADEPGANAANSVKGASYQPDDAALVCDSTFLARQIHFSAAEIEVYQL